MAYVIPTVADFKAQFVRDFPYGTEPSVVMDPDITTAIMDAGINFTERLYANQAIFSRAYLLLSAHYLVTNLRNSSQGVAGQYNWLQNSKGVGNVNEAFAIPQKILDNPEYAQLSKTNYGAAYLAIVIPLTKGNFGIAYGRTLP